MVSDDRDRRIQIVSIAVSATVASVLLIVIVTICGIAIYRRLSRRTNDKPRKARKIVIETNKKTESIVMSSNRPSRPGSVLTNDGSTTDFWSRQEKRRKHTEDKIRRLNIADNFEGVSDGNIVVPPPAVRRSVAFDTPDDSDGGLMAHSPEAVSSLKRGDAEHKSAFSSVISTNSEPAPSTSTEANPALPPLIIKKLSTSDDSQSFVSSLKQADDKEAADEHEEDVTSPADTTPKVGDFQAPDEDGFYRLRVG